MKLFIIPQYQRMMDHFRAVANGCAIDKMRDPICRVEAKEGAVQLADHTMNVLALKGGETQISATADGETVLFLNVTAAHMTGKIGTCTLARLRT